LSSLGESELFNIVPRRNVMRVWIMLGVGALMLATAVVPSGAWGATMDDVKKEMAQYPSPGWGARLVMYVPMAGSGNTLVAMTDVCLSGGRLRPIAGGGTTTDMGPWQGDTYSVQIFRRDGGGYDFYQYERKVSLPDCK
jgi:hypothetical protein